MSEAPRAIGDLLSLLFKEMAIPLVVFFLFSQLQISKFLSPQEVPAGK